MKINNTIKQALIDNIEYCTLSEIDNIIDLYNKGKLQSARKLFLIGVILGKVSQYEFRYFENFGVGDLDLVGEIEGFIKSTLKQKPLIENSTIDTEENKSENWRLTKYP